MNQPTQDAVLCKFRRAFRGGRWLAAPLLLLALSACQQEPTPTRAATAVPSITTEPRPTGTAGLSTLLLSATPTEQPTFTPIPTTTATAEATATTAPSPTSLPSPTAISTVAPTPMAAGEFLTPGQAASSTLLTDQAILYPYQGTRFQPVLIFVEAAGDLDVSLSVHPGTEAPGADLAQMEVAASAEQSGPNRPEIIVFTPEDDGPYTIAVRSNPDTPGAMGAYTLYLFDTQTAAEGVELAAGALAAGETASHQVTSNDGRPVLCYLDPTDESDLILRALDSDGGVLTEANFSGPGSAEAVYLLPLQTTTYTCQVTAAARQTSTYEMALIALP